MFDAELDHIREQVLPVMIEIGVIDFTQADNLRKVPLGYFVVMQLECMLFAVIAPAHVVKVKVSMM